MQEESAAGCQVKETKLSDLESNLRKLFQYRGNFEDHFGFSWDYIFVKIILDKSWDL